MRPSPAIPLTPHRLDGSQSRLRYVIGYDLYRYNGATGGRSLLRVYLDEPGFRFTFWLRMAACLQQRSALLRPFYWLSRWQRRRYEIRYGISIPCGADIGPGLFIGHFGGIVVHPQARIGRCCNLSNGVTIGQANRGVRKGCPVIGDCVFIGPGAKILGKVIVGSHVAVGANAVVTTDVEDNQVVAGVPARVISSRGSEGYVNWTDYDQP